jgi:ketosteroid isomerase-like protein
VTPSENLDLVRSIYAAWENGEYRSAEWAHSQIEFVIADGPSPGRWKGLAGLGGAARDQLDAWQGLRFEADEYRELDDERVLVLMHFSARGKKSGLEMGQVQTDGATLFHVRGGKVARYVFYWQRERAVTDLGLDPESGSSGIQRPT